VHPKQINSKEYRHKKQSINRQTYFYHLVSFEAVVRILDNIFSLEFIILKGKDLLEAQALPE
jgi:hypothetical protein